MEEQNERKGWGGARKGAGRKRIPDRDCKVAFGLSVEAKRRLVSWADARGLSLQEAANRIFSRLEVGEQ